MSANSQDKYSLTQCNVTGVVSRTRLVGFSVRLCRSFGEAAHKKYVVNGVHYFLLLGEIRDAKSID